MTEINTVVKSVKDVIEDRLSSSMYGSFAISWIIWNWKVIYVTFFVDQNLLFQYELINKLKVDYISSLYHWSSFGGSVWSVIEIFIGPAVSAYIIVWFISKLDFIFFKKSYLNKIKIDQEKSDIQSKLQSSRAKILQNTQKIVESEKNIELTKEKYWDKDYGNLLNQINFRKKLEMLKYIIYDNKGYAHNINNDKQENKISSDIVAFLHVNGLIAFLNESNSHVAATEKGLYFLKKYMDGREQF